MEVLYELFKSLVILRYLRRSLINKNVNHSSALDQIMLYSSFFTNHRNPFTNSFRQPQRVTNLWILDTRVETVHKVVDEPGAHKSD